MPDLQEIFTNTKESIFNVLLVVCGWLMSLFTPGAIVGLFVLFAQFLYWPSKGISVDSAQHLFSITAASAGVITAIFVPVLFSDKTKSSRILYKKLFKLSYFSLMSFIISLIFYYLCETFEINDNAPIYIVFLPEFCLIVALYLLCEIMGCAMKELKNGS